MSKLRWYILFAVIPFVCTLPAQNKVDGKSERNNIRSGNSFYKDNKFTEAEVAYRKALDANENSKIGTYNLGASLYKQEKWQKARNAYESVAQSASSPAEAAEIWHNMGNISMKEQNYAQSIEEYKNALRLNPSDDETRYNLRLAQLKLQEQQQQQQNQKDQNKDQKDQQQNKNDDKQQQQNKDQEQKQDQQNKEQPRQDQQQQQNQQKQQPQEGRMSEENAQQILDAIQRDEQETQEKAQKARMLQQKRKKTDKEW